MMVDGGVKKCKRKNFSSFQNISLFTLNNKTGYAHYSRESQNRRKKQEII